MAEYITVQQGLDMINEGDEIVTGLGCAEAHDLLSSIHLIADRISKPVEITNCLPMHDFKFQDAEFADKFFVNGWFYSPTIRKMHKNKNASFIPNNLHLAGSRRLQHKVPRFYIGSCSAVDEHGYISLSTSNTYEKEMIDTVDIVILETNPKFPRTFGDVQLHIDEIDYLIEANYEVPVIASAEPNEKDEIIGQLIADLIQDGDCIQLGIGGIPNAVARALYGKKDLGVHTEMLTSEMAKLAKAGVITGAKKQINRGKMVTTFIMGDKKLYEFAHNNPSVEVIAGSWVNNPYVIMQNDNQVSINTAIEVDLTGQVASESIGHIQYSGTGGQADT
ncbi:MAG: 4-hydroxybutyrate--acetyl-CoA CoA transferase, partial [Erysipelothrix sp.]|nr:4-hydroxybutyrate--acetyl-CoA CoA transferase [Erysipelothrix sp.]